MIVIDDPEFHPKHGVDGWRLEDMDWDPETGISQFEYSNTSRGGTWVVYRSQPTNPEHTDWLDRPFQNVLSLD